MSFRVENNDGCGDAASVSDVSKIIFSSENTLEKKYDSDLKESSLSGRVISLEKQMGQVESEVEILVSNCNELGTQYKYLSDRYNQCIEIANKHKLRVEELNKYKDTLESDIKAATSIISEQDALIEKAETKMKELLGLMKNPSSLLESNISQEPLQDLIKEAFNDVTRLYNERSSLQEQLNIREKECDNITNQKNSLEEKIEELTKEVEELKAKLKSNQLIRQKKVLARLPKNLKDNQETYYSYGDAYGSNLWGMTNFYRLNRNKNIDPFKGKTKIFPPQKKGKFVTAKPPAVIFLEKLKRKYVNDYMRTLKTTINNTYKHKPLWEKTANYHYGRNVSLQLNLGVQEQDYCEPKRNLKSIKSDSDVVEKFRILLSAGKEIGLENKDFNQMFNNFKRAFFNAVIDDLQEQQELLCKKNPDSGEFYKQCFEEIYGVINAQIANTSLNKAPAKSGVILSEDDPLPGVKRFSEPFRQSLPK